MEKTLIGELAGFQVEHRIYIEGSKLRFESLDANSKRKEWRESSHFHKASIEAELAREWLKIVLDRPELNSLKREDPFADAVTVIE